MMTILGFIAGFMSASLIAIIMMLFKPRQESDDSDAAAEQPVLKRSINDSTLPVRVRGLLRDADIRTVEDVVKYKKKELLKFRNFGEVSLGHLEKFVEEQGVEWK